MFIKICLLSIFIVYQNTYQKIHFWAFQVNVGLLRYFIIMFETENTRPIGISRFFQVYNYYRPTQKTKQKGNLKKKSGSVLGTFCPPKRQNFKWYLNEFLVVLFPKYVTLNQTTLRIHKKGQTNFFCKNLHWIVCANLINLQKNNKQTVFELYLALTMPLNHVLKKIKNIYESKKKKKMK